MGKSAWFTMKKRDMLTIIWVIISFIILYAPWGWSGSEGEISFLFITSSIFLVLIPFISMLLINSSKNNEKEDIKNEMD